MNTWIRIDDHPGVVALAGPDGEGIHLTVQEAISYTLASAFEDFADADKLAGAILHKFLARLDPTVLPVVPIRLDEEGQVDAQRSLQEQPNAWFRFDVVTDPEDGITARTEMPVMLFVGIDEAFSALVAVVVNPDKLNDPDDYEHHLVEAGVFNFRLTAEAAARTAMLQTYCANVAGRQTETMTNVAQLHLTRFIREKFGDEVPDGSEVFASADVLDAGDPDKERVALAVKAFTPGFESAIECLRLEVPTTLAEVIVQSWEEEPE
ncbi:MAG: hypothetical protein D6746_07470 [Bacteroidetes bacterium]|nr:MAG: hypothetical protein D6746_07470 [Bacteroidota bacterium]